MSQRLLSFFWKRLTKACSARRDNYQRQWIGESHHSPHMGSANQAADGRNTTTDVGTLTDRRLRSLQDRRGGAGTQRYTDQKSTCRTRRSLPAARMSRSSGSRTGYFFQVAAAVSWGWWRVTKWWPGVANYPVKPLTSGVQCTSIPVPYTVTYSVDVYSCKAHLKSVGLELSSGTL